MLKSDFAALLTGLMLAAGVMVAGGCLERTLSPGSTPSSRSRYLLDTKFGSVECDRLERTLCGLSASECHDLRTYTCLTDVRFEERL